MFRNAFVLACMFALGLCHSSLAFTRLGVSVQAYSAAYSDCATYDDPHMTISMLAGATGSVNVQLTAWPQEVRGITLGAPGRLFIRAATTDRSGSAIVPGLAQRLNVRPLFRWHPWFGDMSPTAISSWHSSGPYVGGEVVGTSWKFSFDVPPDLAGTRLYFDILYVSEYGDTLTSPAAKPTSSGHSGDLAHLNNTVAIVAPCSVEDKDRAAGSYVMLAESQGDHARAIALADSLLQTGWCDVRGLKSATQAAGYLGLHALSDEFEQMNIAAHGRDKVYPGMNWN